MELGELEKRLKILEDKDAIKEVHREYVFFLIMGRWNEMADFFTDDATASIASQPPRKGKKEIHTLFTEVFAKNVPKDEGHFVTQPVISVDGDKAKGHWLLYVLLPKPVGWRQARYDCEYARVEGQWKISSLVFQAPWPPGASA